MICLVIVSRASQLTKNVKKKGGKKQLNTISILFVVSDFLLPLSMSKVRNLTNFN